MNGTPLNITVHSGVLFILLEWTVSRTQLLDTLLVGLWNLIRLIKFDLKQYLYIYIYKRYILQNTLNINKNIKHNMYQMYTLW